MKTIKKFWLYFILFVLLYLFVTFLTNFEMRDVYKDINFSIKTDNPQITVTEAKANRSIGYIIGNITNNTNEHIKECYLKVDLYNGNNSYLGTEYKKIEYFNVTETINFEIEYKYSNVKFASLSIVSEMAENKDTKILNNLYEKDFSLLNQKGVKLLYLF